MCPQVHRQGPPNSEEKTLLHLNESALDFGLCPNLTKPSQQLTIEKMSLESFVEYLMLHNVLVIRVLIALILASVTFIAFRIYIQSRDDNQASPSAPGISMEQLDEALKKILEKAQHVPTTSTVSVPATNADGTPVASPETAALTEEIQMLKKDLETKQAEIKAMKDSGGAVGAATSTGEGGAAAATMSEEDKGKLLSQIKELQGKLQEYEIISEDIADLSFYKEENAKLQAELKRLGENPAPAAAPAPVAAVPAPSAPVPAVPNPTAQPAPAEPVVASAPAPTPSTVAAEVATAQVATPTPTPSAPQAAPIAEAAPAESGIDTELMKEFEQAVAEQKKPVALAVETPVELPPAAAESVDFDKMLAEAQQIQSAPSGSVPAPKLDDMDPAKLEQEAAQLQEAPAPASDKVVMEQFEEFMKKGQTGS